MAICDNCKHDWNPDLVKDEVRDRQAKVRQETGKRVCPICSQEYVQTAIRAAAGEKRT